MTGIPVRIKRLFRLRFAILYPLGLYGLFFSNTTDASIRAGLWLIIPGVLLRLLSNAYAVKTERLTTCGPYAYLRNPLYLGTILIFLGFIVLLHIYWAGLVTLLVFSFAYRRTIRAEEGQLEQIYGQVYRDYKRNVPSILPRLTPYLAGEKWGFSFERLRRSKEHKVFVWLFVVIVALHVRSEILIEREGVDLRLGLLMAFAVGLICLDVLSEFFAKHHSSSGPDHDEWCS
jgi:Ca2+/Na+ antiporter